MVVGGVVFMGSPSGRPTPSPRSRQAAATPPGQPCVPQGTSKDTGAAPAAMARRPHAIDATHPPDQIHNFPYLDDKNRSPPSSSFSSPYESMHSRPFLFIMVGGYNCPVPVRKATRFAQLATAWL